MSVYKELTKLGVDADVIASDDPLDDYDVIVAPMLYMLRDGAAESLAAFVKRGGQLLATYFTGYVDKNQLCMGLQMYSESSVRRSILCTHLTETA